LKSPMINPHLFLHAMSFLMCCEYFVTMKNVEIFFHYITTISNMFHGSIITKVVICSSCFTFTRARNSPCYQLGCLGFLFEPPRICIWMEEVFFFNPPPFFWGCIFVLGCAFNWKYFDTIWCYINLAICQLQFNTIWCCKNVAIIVIVLCNLMIGMW